MKLTTAYCKNCRRGFRVQDAELPNGDETVVEVIVKSLPDTAAECPQCHARIPISVVDTLSPAQTHSAQDSSGTPIAPGNWVRYRGKDYEIEQVGFPEPVKGGGRGVKLKGLEVPASEWSIDRI